MNKLKEINGKFYQEAEVVMLATKEVIGEASIMQEDDKLYPVREYGNRNLYFLSNEEIKIDDWCFEIYNGVSKAPKDTPRFTDKDANIWWLRQMNMNCSANDPECKKITATTDKLMNNDLSHVPQPSQSFIQAYIKAYNEGKPITKVLVEMEFKANHAFPQPILKVNSSNEITIKKIKDSWTREEVIELLSKHFVEAGSKIGLGQNVTEFTKIWIEENL